MDAWQFSRGGQRHCGAKRDSERHGAPCQHSKRLI
jgi:hypothetical protein